MLVAAMGVGIFRWAENTANRSQQAVLRDVTNEIMDSIHSRIQNAEFCFPTLGGGGLPVTPGTRTDLVLNFIYDPRWRDPGTGAAQTNLRKDVVATQGVILKELVLDVDQRPDMRTQLMEGGVLVEHRRYPATIQATFASADNLAVIVNRSGIIAGGVKTQDYGVPLFVWVRSTTSLLSSCFGRQSAGTMCNEIGGFFMPDPGLNYYERCRQSPYTQRIRYDAAGNELDLTADPQKTNGTCRSFGFVPAGGNCDVSADHDNYRFQDAHRLLGNSAWDLCRRCF